MSIQVQLSDIIKQCALSNIEVLKISSDDIATRVQTFDTDKTLFIEANMAEVIPEFKGEFGITNLKMLSGLLQFTNYQLNDSTFRVRTREINGIKVLDQFEFGGKGSKSVFKLMDIQHVPPQATITSVPWNIILDEVDKAKITEFQQFAGLYAEVDKQFGVSVDGSNLVMSFGAAASSTHSGSMVFSEITGSLNGTLVFPVDKFLMLMKIGQNAQSSRLMFTSKGVLGLEAMTLHGTYKYYLRQSVRG